MSTSTHPPAVVARRLNESTVVIVGGTSGVGLASAFQFAAAGVRAMALVGRNQARGADAARAVAAKHPGARVDFFACDAMNLEEVERLVPALHERLGRIDVLVNSTTTNYTPDLLHRTPAESFSTTMSSLVLAPMFVTRCVLPSMREQKTGVIINMASDAAKVPTPGETILGAAMAAIVMFSRTLAVEAKRDGIRVNVLTPSLIAGTPTSEGVQRGGFSAKLFAKAATLAHLGVAVPDDLAALIVFLSSPEARRITGQVISVNGGISAG